MKLLQQRAQPVHNRAVLYEEAGATASYPTARNCIGPTVHSYCDTRVTIEVYA